MKKHNKSLWLCIVIIILLFIVEINRGIINSSIAFSNNVKQIIFNTIDNINKYVDIHLSQAKTISMLREVEIKKQAQDIEIMAMNAVLDDILSLLDINIRPSFPHIHLVNAYSYVNIGQYSQVWLDSDSREYQKNKVFGLVKNGYAAGIAIKNDNGLLGILNGDTKLSYGVYIGDSKSIGILKTNLSNNVVVEYIYAWSDINVGDEIITSGLDGIFFEGIKVGKVAKVRQEYGYIVVDVDLYVKNNDIGYFWLVDIPSRNDKMLESTNH